LKNAEELARDPEQYESFEKMIALGRYSRGKRNSQARQ